MEIRIKETQKIETVEIIDPATQIEWTQGYTDDDGDIQYDEEREEYTCTLETYEWWHEYATEWTKAQGRWRDLLELARNEDQDTDQMIWEFEKMPCCSVEEEPPMLNELCDKWATRLNGVVS